MALSWCVTGFVLVLNVNAVFAQEALIVSFQASTSNNGSLYTYRGTIQQLSIHSELTPEITSFSLPGVTITSLTSDPENDTLYFYDYYTQGIYLMSPFSSPQDSQTVLVYHASRSINTDIALDWISHNLYCTDGLLGLIFVINLASSNNMRRILLDTNMESAKSITVDPTSGYMFWSDTFKGSHRIERADLSGQRRRVIVFISVLNIGDVSTDIQEKRIYWTDRIRNTIERCSYDGQNREIFHRRNNNYFSYIMTDQTHVCVTEDFLDLLICKYKGTDEDVISEKYTRQPYGLEIYDKSLKPPVIDKCMSMVCQHFCAPNPIGAACLCKDGFTLQPDGTSCTANDDLPVKGLLLGNYTHICMINFMELMSTLPKPHSCFLENLSNLKFLSVDVATSTAFYADTGSGNLIAASLLSGSTLSLTQTGTVTGLAYDWVGRNLYWAEEDSTNIKLVNVDTLSSSELGLSTRSPSDLVVDPHSRMLYWLSGLGTPYYSIQTVSMDGSSAPSVVVSTSNSLTALFYDSSAHRLYWVEDGVLKSSVGDGSDVFTHSTIASHYHSQLIVYKMYVVWRTFENSHIHTMSMENNEIIAHEVDGFGEITGMAVFDKSLQQSQPEPCAVLNGGCSHICIPTSDTERSCACSFGFTLQPDQTSCKSKPVLTNEFLLLPDLNHARLYQLSLGPVPSPEFLALDVPVDRPVDAVYDHIYHYIYWTEANLQSIKRAKLDGSDVQTILTFSQEYPERLAYDAGTGNLYYTTSASGDTTVRDGRLGVLRATEDRVYDKVLVQTDGTADYMQGLLIYPKKALLIWSGVDFDGPTAEGAIYRSFMDGTAVSVLVSDVYHPQGLAMDFATEKVYWAAYGGIGYTDLLGNKGTLIQSTDLTDIVLANDVIYYTGRNTRNIMKIDKNTGSNIPWLNSTPEVGNVISLHIYQGQQQQGNAACINNGLCAVFCLPTHNGKTCACADGVHLQPDGRTCGSSVTCGKTIPNGLMSSFCLGIVSESCSYTCNSGYIKNPVHDTITCLPTGIWSTERNNLCLVDSPPTDTSSLPTIAGVVAAAVLIILISIIVFMWVCKRKRKPTQRQDHTYWSTIHNMNTPTVAPNQYNMNQNTVGAVGHPVASTGRTEKDYIINPAYLQPPERRARCPSPDHVYAELPPAYSKLDSNYIPPMEDENDDAQTNPYIDPEPVSDKEMVVQQERKKRRSILESARKSTSSWHQSEQSMIIDNEDEVFDNPYFVPVDETVLNSVSCPQNDKSKQIESASGSNPSDLIQNINLDRCLPINNDHLQKDTDETCRSDNQHFQLPPEPNGNLSDPNQQNTLPYIRQSSQEGDSSRVSLAINTPPAQLCGDDYIDVNL
ncbi:low-density lipoprotein receptor-related protein 4-like [Argopecten irradians]|uniref:low-density lipoprotein receptor-related protein 4-like n=1 Tax=Argopecten irradians TaxID=31199 RepID=UPI003722FBFA